MKNYNITSPSLDGILSHDYLYFEGIKCPPQLYTVRDGSSTSPETNDILEKYFNDLYNLFLRKICDFAMFERTGDEETMKLQALLQELIKVKKLIALQGVEDQKDLV